MVGDDFLSSGDDSGELDSAFTEIFWLPSTGSTFIGGKGRKG